MAVVATILQLLVASQCMVLVLVVYRKYKYRYAQASSASLGHQRVQVVSDQIPSHVTLSVGQGRSCCNNRPACSCICCFYFAFVLTRHSLQVATSYTELPRLLCSAVTMLNTPADIPNQLVNVSIC